LRIEVRLIGRPSSTLDRSRSMRPAAAPTTAPAPCTFSTAPLRQTGCTTARVLASQAEAIVDR